MPFLSSAQVWAVARKSKCEPDITLVSGVCGHRVCDPGAGMELAHLSAAMKHRRIAQPLQAESDLTVKRITEAWRLGAFAVLEF